MIDIKNKEKLIKKKDFVIDIGGGHNSFHRANVVIEKYLNNNYERGAKLKINKYQYVIESDGIRLPFKNKSIDYTYSNHVIEHSSDPKKFIKELVRVSSCGYLGIPSALSEMIFNGYPYHKWIFFIKNKKLLFSKKNKKFINQSKFFDKIFQALYQSPEFIKFYRAKFFLFKINLNWSKNLKIYNQKIEKLNINLKILKKITKLKNNYKPIKYSYFKKFKIQEIVKKMINPLNSNSLKISNNFIIDKITEEKIFFYKNNKIIMTKSFKKKYYKNI